MSDSDRPIADWFLSVPGSVGGPTEGGYRAYPSIVRWITENGWQNLRMLDVCCGVGTLGLLARRDLGSGIIASLVLSDIDWANAQSARLTAEWHEMGNVECIESDGIQSVPSDPPFDLIVSNPPHYLSDGHHHSADHDWRFHRYFFHHLPEYLRVGGEAWLIEAGDGGTDKLARVELDATRIELVSYAVEPNDPAFSWLKLKRIT